jgi:glycosyltransferase involved in cell wall biosynthesis
VTPHPVRPRRPAAEPERPTVTVAVCTYNRAALLDRTLAGLRRVRLPAGVGWEVLVVNNASTDDTDAVLARHAGELPLRRLHEPTPGVVHARNTALAHARGEFVLWTDDDVEVAPDWVEKHLEAFDRFGADVVFGRVDPVWEGTPPGWLIPDSRGLFALLDLGGPARVVADPRVIGFNVNLAVRRSALDRIGPYRAMDGGRVGGGEDVDLFRRAYAAGLTVVYQPDARVGHVIPPARCEKRFHRRAVWRGTAYHLGLLRDEAEAGGLPTVFGIPRYFLRINLGYVARYLRASLTGDRGRAFYYELKLIRLAALLRLALAGPGRPPAGPAP